MEPSGLRFVPYVHRKRGAGVSLEQPEYHSINGLLFPPLLGMLQFPAVYPFTHRHSLRLRS